MTNSKPTAFPYPLYWPEGFGRSASQVDGSFKTTLHAAANNVRRSLSLFGKDTGKPVSEIIISSNILPLEPKPSDSGVSVWFTWDGAQRCLAVDRYKAPEANLQAIHHIIEARRTEMRHGGIQIVRQTFKGFTALPAPAKDGKHWTEILGLPATATKQQIALAYREAAKRSGGNETKLLTINTARDLALRDRGGE